MIPEYGYAQAEDTPFSLFKAADSGIPVFREQVSQRIKTAIFEEVAPGVSIVVPELEAEKCAGAWEEEQAKGWNENIKPGASVQWYQEGARSPNLGEVIEIDPEHQTYKVRDAYTGEVSVQTRVKIFSKKVGGVVDEQVSQRIKTAIFEEVAPGVLVCLDSKAGLRLPRNYE